MSNEHELNERIILDNKNLKSIVCSTSNRYRKNFQFSYDKLILEKFKEKFPEKVKEYEYIAIKKEPWLKYQPKNLQQRIDGLIFPSILEKREGVSRKMIGAHLTHLSYCENHDRRVFDYGDFHYTSSDINYGNHYRICDIVGTMQQNIKIGNMVIPYDPSMISNPYSKDCLDTLREPLESLKHIGEKIELLYNSGKTCKEICCLFSNSRIPESDISAFINKLEDYLIICMFYGLRGYSKTTQFEIAKKLGITQPAVFKRVCKIQDKIANIYLKLTKEDVVIEAT